MRIVAAATATLERMRTTTVSAAVAFLAIVAVSVPMVRGTSRQTAGGGLRLRRELRGRSHASATGILI
jgi:hypothetical protein